MGTLNSPPPGPDPACVAWSDAICNPLAIRVRLDTPGVGEFICDGLEEGAIRVMVTDSAEVVILPSSIWDKAFRLKDRRRLEARQAKVRRARARAPWGGYPGR